MLIYRAYKSIFQADQEMSFRAHFLAIHNLYNSGGWMERVLTTWGWRQVGFLACDDPNSHPSRLAMQPEEPARLDSDGGTVVDTFVA